MGIHPVREHGGLTCVGYATLFYSIRLFSLVPGSFLYLVGAVLFALSPILVRMREFLLYRAYKKPTRLLG